MWKRLSRLWHKDASFDSEREMRLAARAPEPAAIAAEPEPTPIDEIALALERFDAELAECGPEAAVGSMRELVLDAPTDSRVLRRAAALSKALGDEDLGAQFEEAAVSSSGEPLAVLGQSFLGMDDALLALALGDGAVARASQRRGRGRPDGDDGGLAAGRLVGALALSRLGEHERVMERLEPSLDDGVAVRVRWGLAALALEDAAAWARVAGELGPAEPWLDEVCARISAFPKGEGAPNDPQRLLFSLYGAVLLDDAPDGERLGPERLVRWMEALATLVKEVLPAGTRPAWVSPRGEVLARWLGSLLPEEGAMPLSARLPKQPVLVVLADDHDLAAACETRAWQEGALPTFQAVKDPSEIGSPMADVIGVFRSGIELPFEGLEAERAADRSPPRMVVGRLVDEARQSRVEASELAGFLAWVRSRTKHLSLANPAAGEARIPLDVARDV